MDSDELGRAEQLSSRKKERLWGRLGGVCGVVTELLQQKAIVACISASAGFSYALGSAKKRNTQHIEQGIHRESIALASRALARGSAYAVAGVGFLSFCVWKALGVHSLEEFRHKMERLFKSKVPDIPRSSSPGRSDFKSFRELFEYLSEEDKSKSASKDL